MTRTLYFVASLGLAAIAALAQTGTPTGAIGGTVYDSIGDPVEKATVQAKNTQTGATFKAVSANNGKYTLERVPAGVYDVSSAVPALMPFARKDVEVKASETASLDIHFKDTTQLNTLGEDREHALADQKRHVDDTSPAPRTPDGHPDLSGVWWRPNTVDPGHPEFLPAAMAITKQRLANNGKDSPQAHCLPSGPLRYGPLWEFVQSKDFLVYISDDESPGFHQIYLDGRSQPADPNPAWYGHSIGHWDGDTLVVDRVGFDPRVWLDQASHPHSDMLHIVERYHRRDMGHMEIETTVDDPGVLAKPWTVKSVADLAHEEIYEFICQENNRDLSHLVGK
ncbi:MAG TPA: carboxypeptidase-like regulatory domain-containing protein [Bryobacteraceae bacterium]|nr:carboxypeptidase-like regulatory domain-containing protein [Bryobacteraceae bacterium]